MNDLLRLLSDATDSRASESKRITLLKLQQLRFAVNLLAVVPYSSREDLLTVLTRLSCVIDKHGEPLRDAVHESFEGSVRPAFLLSALLGLFC